ncbi:WXG100 family type VII secretion target [Labedaea rhizosphaerae]|uniref:PPE family protein n=1 Tax=Labedaea rhizosphaerae TaxID=598644 RepID=A0A4V3CYQ6_LABRH|nr:hypothetical protein [Labedaea rhizosphaerae]TDP95008.1 hypothetical protein EV186_105240 [Labedaea rhizosphaerae]
MTPTSTADLLARINETAAAVRGRSWASPELSGGMGGLGNLAGGTDPVAGLSSAGLGWFAPFVSFLSQPSSVLQGNPGPVSTGASGFAQGGQAVSGLASQYQQAASTETKGWSGDASSAYQGASTQILDSISSLAEAAYSMSDAIAGAGEVVGQAVDIITQLGGEAIGQIVPIMSQAVAAAPLTGGQSIAAAIPQCVAIATNYGQQMLAKLAALLASGQNLLKLVKGALAVVQLVTKALKQLGQQSTSGGGSSQTGGATQQGGAQQKQVDAPTANGNAATESGAATDGATSGLSSGGDVSQAPVTSQSLADGSLGSGPLSGAGYNNGTAAGTYTPRQTTTASGFAPGGYGMAPMGAGTGSSRDTEAAASRRAQGPLTGAFDNDEKELTAGRAATPAKSAQRGGGMGGVGMGGARGAQREEDKEHRSRIELVEYEDVFGAKSDDVIAPSVIGEVQS